MRTEDKQLVQDVIDRMLDQSNGRVYKLLLNKLNEKFEKSYQFKNGMRVYRE